VRDLLLAYSSVFKVMDLLYQKISNIEVDGLTNGEFWVRIF
jgi:hypothetical protein